MEKKIFNPEDWLQQEEIIQPAAPAQVNARSLNDEELEFIIKQIEAKKVDIAPVYTDWRNIAYAFINTYGEQGRDYFHRVSCFYPGYTHEECNTQYTNCLKSGGGEITLKTFFLFAKQAGININFQKEQGTLPTFPESLFPQLPEFLQKAVAIATTPEEKDILLIGSLVAISSCFPMLFGIYDGKKVFANLFLFITAQASAGKGRLVHCKQLVYPVHKKFREESRLAMQEYNAQLKEYK